jgi:hypothetical protein
LEEDSEDNPDESEFSIKFPDPLLYMIGFFVSSPNNNSQIVLKEVAGVPLNQSLSASKYGKNSVTKAGWSKSKDNSRSQSREKK